MSVCGWAVLAVAVALGYLVQANLGTLAYGKELGFAAAEACALHQLPTPCEDLTAFRPGALFAGGGDLWSTFALGSEQAVAGAIYLVEGTKVTPLPILGEPPKLVLHGIYFSARSRRLYGVNHDEATGESIEVFDVLEEDGVSLKHAGSIRSPLFANFALNDVVEGAGKDEVYVTEWQAAAFPAGGKRGLSSAPLELRLKRALSSPLTFFKVPLTRVFRCTVSTQRCSVASSARFVGANGIAISDDRHTVFVNDAPAQRLTVLARQPDGSLEEVSSFGLKHIVDNLEMTADGALHAGTIPFPYASASVCQEAPALSASKVVSGRRVSCGAQPGGLLEIGLLGTGESARGKSFVDGRQTDILTHDGTALDGVSSALRVGAKVVLGSPHAKGLLFCDA